MVLFTGVTFGAEMESKESLHPKTKKSSGLLGWSFSIR